MSSVDLVKIILVVCWVLLGVGVVSYVWRKQAKAAGERSAQQTAQSLKNAENLEKLYNYLVEHREGITMNQAMQFLLVEEAEASQCLGQLATKGVVRQFVGENGANYYALNQESEFNTV